MQVRRERKYTEDSLDNGGRPPARAGNRHRSGRPCFAIAVHANESMAQAEEFANEIRQKGGKAVAVQADLTQSGPTSGLIEQASSALGPIGVVINNASVFLDDSADKPDPAIFDAHFAVHVRAPSLIAAAFVEQLPADNSGLIVNIIDQRVLALTPRFLFLHTF